jgi:hypothetical protein
MICIYFNNRTALNEIYPFEVAANLTMDKFNLTDENIRNLIGIEEINLD